MPSRAAIVAIVDPDVRRLRRLGDVLQEHGMRVVLVASCANATQLIAASRCDVVAFGDPLGDPGAPELCAALRERLGGLRPFFVSFGPAGEQRQVHDRHASSRLGDPALVEAIVEAISARRSACQAG